MSHSVYLSAFTVYGLPSTVNGLRNNLGDAHFRVERAKSCLLAETLAALLLEDAHLRAARFAVDDADNLGAAHKRSARGHFAAVSGQKQNLVEGHFFARLGCPTVELDDGTWRDLYLTTPGLNDRVHGPSLNLREHRIISQAVNRSPSTVYRRRFYGERQTVNGKRFI